ncbi:MAG: SIMPL domain-containing protein [Alphaproteobacteria bacterium]|nr:SIMPL domain-containing protein [Alphaproteobacteria bacterium]MBV9694383.1 SIMPL domain-containing protein [Alphaproteobacteria bacterium]
MKTLWALCTVLLAGPLQAVAAEQNRVVVMTGEGSVTAMPDQAIVHAGVVTEARAATDAMAANAEAVARVMAALKALGIDRRAIYTANFSIAPRSTSAKDGRPDSIVGYDASNAISVKLDDISRTGKVLDAMIGAGANQSAGVEFSIKAPGSLLIDARRKAALDAVARARTYAAALGQSLGPIVSISEGGYGGIKYEGVTNVEALLNNLPSAFADNDGHTEEDVSPSEQTISASVTVTWALK